MAERIHPLAGKPAPASSLIDVDALIHVYYAEKPDPSVVSQRVAFGTSGHRGTSLERSFNEWHVLAITQAICDYRAGQGIDGPLFLGIDTHALSAPAAQSALEVLAANGVQVMLATNDEFTPTPAISHAILKWNRGRTTGLADGIVVTPSHNPPRDGGFKYNPPNGGPAGGDITGPMQAAANKYLEQKLADVKRMPLAQALKASTTHRYDYLDTYVSDLGNVIDMDVIRDAKVRMGVDPLGGAGVHYWAAIADRYKLDLTVVSDAVDPTFRFMTCDWDGQIRLDPSSPYAMQQLLAIKDRFDVGFACDTDHDRHGIVTPATGLLPPNHYLSVCIDYLFRNRTQWGAQTAVGKTAVSTALIDRLTARLGRRLYEVPVGFKWFTEGLMDGSLGFVGEESAGATFLRLDGSVWTTDKDGITAALLSGEITARTGRDPGTLYAEMAQEFGSPVSSRVDAPANAQQKKQLGALSPDQVKSSEMAGDEIEQILSNAPGNGAAIGGIKVISSGGWFAARPSGTEDIYKIYGESFKGPEHLQRILQEAQAMVDAAIAPAGGS
ncbi:phosphoglucomutase (alpha-D-glucose-1,6-bisphosphate-dependent) [Variovorax sp. J22R133]|uniref:phosphoglucomutase (alpha-D-glucose-1,6-bisphosphate-dependent) n=1 Tax=Variovorax brevis TaxID=3053503 RepID=UPI002578AE5F|nr:phosphoglucomutase (alpha-D-glucose-1,6-bisphosphate-dependent) [Variovorax sp. J22R133]MDM0110976.1 phosphoglucomutase (alpha-D-glucose-1,6-bisphosphate-dependent) [Variovorax sp. J22R133]